MRVDVTTETVVLRPVEEVAAYLVDAGNAAEWYAIIVRVEPLTPPPYDVGSRMTFEARGPFPMTTAPVMSAARRRANRADLARLKAVLEG